MKTNMHFENVLSVCIIIYWIPLPSLIIRLGILYKIYNTHFSEYSTDLLLNRSENNAFKFDIREKWVSNTL